MKDRHYHYIHNFRKEKKIDPEKKTVKYDYSFDYKTIDIKSDDSFDGYLDIIAFPITYLHHIDNILELFNYRSDVHYFYEQCREVISVPEKHQNEKGEGKLNFQVYFHNFPYSVVSLHRNALVVIILRPMESGSRDMEYDLVGYIHANEFKFSADPVAPGEEYPGYYYNLLRINERVEQGERIYRRKKIFSLLFSVLLSLVEENDFHFIYAAMGKENQAIVSALKKLADHYNKHHHILQVKSNTHINLLFGSSSAEKNITEITWNEQRLSDLYVMNMRQLRNYMFNPYPTEDAFRRMFGAVREYSKSSGAYMITDGSGNMKACCIAINWGDYFSMELDNPKGVFKAYASLNLTGSLLYFCFIQGEAKYVRLLLKGLASKYRKEHGCQISIITSYPGDPLASVKESLIYDDFSYFIIEDRMEEYEKFVEHSRDTSGNAHLFLDLPLY